MLARAVGARLRELRIDVVSTDRDLDITDRDAVRAFAECERPTLIVNTAAYTRVDDAEADEAQALRVNAQGAAHLAEVARDQSAWLLHFSTDYVFDGHARTPYREDSPALPLSAYGRTKFRGERLVCETLRERSYVVRTSWLFGENGHNFVKTVVERMREREELRIVDDQLGRPTYTADLAVAALSLLGIDRGGGGPPAPWGIYHFANAGATTWHGLGVASRDACVDLGVTLKVARIVPVTTDQFPRAAARPAYSVLDTSKIEAALGRSARPWRAALRDYLSRELAEDPALERREPLP
jgi:dTDP-4-dehydrorhamnose reductase